MPSVNRCFLMGNLTKDPEIRYTSAGTAIANIGLALSRVYSAEDGEKKEEVTFVDVVFFGRQAEVAGQYLKKGRPVFIEGRLQLDTWEDKQTGQKRSRLRVVGENLQLLGGRPERTEAAPASPPAPLRPTPREHPAVEVFREPDLDVADPF
jgi:single-strand DNA-binding protein